MRNKHHMNDERAVSNTILKLLGGNKLIDALGAKDFEIYQSTLLGQDKKPALVKYYFSFTIKPNSSGINRAEITFVPSTELYNMSFYRQRIRARYLAMTREQVEIIGGYANVPPEQLGELFRRATLAQRF